MLKFMLDVHRIHIKPYIITHSASAVNDIDVIKYLNTSKINTANKTFIFAHAGDRDVVFKNLREIQQRNEFRDYWELSTQHHIYDTIRFATYNSDIRNIKKGYDLSLQIACKYGHLEIVKFLEQKNNIASCRNLAIKLAATYNHHHIINHILSIINKRELYDALLSLVSIVTTEEFVKIIIVNNICYRMVTPRIPIIKIINISYLKEILKNTGLPYDLITDITQYY